MPVSYTHLDVYKRQDTDTAIGNVALYHRFHLRKIGDTVVYKEHLSVAAHFEVNGISDNLITESMHLRLNGVTAVSYTHLDVYKRQLLSCPIREMPILWHGH